MHCRQQPGPRHASYLPENGGAAVVSKIAVWRGDPPPTATSPPLAEGHVVAPHGSHAVDVTTNDMPRWSVNPSIHPHDHNGHGSYKSGLPRANGGTTWRRSSAYAQELKQLHHQP